MLPTIFDKTTLPILKETVNFAARHTVLVGNIANMDTPGYKVRDLSVDTFQQKLKELIANRPKKSEPESPGIIASKPGDPLREVHESMTNVLYHDDTNMSMENQVNEIGKNQMLHNVAIAIMSQQFRLLQTAVSERV